MATIKEIAKASGVSIATVSNVINNRPGASDETRKRVLETIKELDYTPNIIAQNLKFKNKKIIGVIVEELTVFSTADIVDGINEYLDKTGYKFIVGNMRLCRKYGEKAYNTHSFHKAVEEEFKLMKSNQVDGIIYVGCNYREIDFIPHNFELPFVAAYTHAKRKKSLSVTFDDEKAAYEATLKLINAGHNNIGIICGLDDNYHTQKRLIGYQKALYDNKILFNPEFIYKGDWSRLCGAKAMEHFMKNNVSAVFAMNDEMAVGVYDYCNEHKIQIGKDISVIGFDNREICEALYPKLSTMEIPLTEIGRKSAQIILEAINNPEKNIKEENIKCQCRYVNRGSVRAK